MQEWKKNIVNDIALVNNNKLTQKDFVRKHWEKFKPVYINFHKFCDDGDLYILVTDFWGRIFRSDIQPVFNSDNQIFSYFKTAVRNRHYDNTHKREVQLVSFTDYDYIYAKSVESEPEQFENKIPEDERPFEDKLQESAEIRNILDELLVRLSEPYHCILAMLYTNDYSHNELRKELGVSISTVRDRINTIRNVAKKIIKERNEEEENFLRKIQ